MHLDTLPETRWVTDDAAQASDVYQSSGSLSAPKPGCGAVAGLKPSLSAQPHVAPARILLDASHCVFEWDTLENP
jgi:hypothetical protein